MPVPRRRSTYRARASGWSMADKQTMARGFLTDMEAGLSDQELKEKYNIYGRDFLIFKSAARDYLRKQKLDSTPPTRTIGAGRFLKDIRSGLDDEELMEKYRLSPRQLQGLFRELIEAGLVTPMELSSRLSITKSQVREAFEEMESAVNELD